MHDQDQAASTATFAEIEGNIYQLDELFKQYEQLYGEIVGQLGEIDLEDRHVQRIVDALIEKHSLALCRRISVYLVEDDGFCNRVKDSFLAHIEQDSYTYYENKILNKVLTLMNSNLETLFKASFEAYIEQHERSAAMQLETLNYALRKLMQPLVLDATKEKADMQYASLVDRMRAYVNSELDVRLKDAFTAAEQNWQSDVGDARIEEHH